MQDAVLVALVLEVALEASDLTLGERHEAHFARESAHEGRLSRAEVSAQQQAQRRPH